MLLAGTTPWLSRPCISHSIHFPYIPFYSAQLARVVLDPWAWVFASHSKHFLAMRSHFFERLRVWFSISHGGFPHFPTPFSPFTTLEGRFLKVLESLDGRKRSWRPQVLLRVEGRKSGIEYSSGGDGAAPCFIGGFYETFWQPFSKNVVHWQIELAICVGFHLFPFHIFFFGFSDKQNTLLP